MLEQQQLRDAEQMQQRLNAGGGQHQEDVRMQSPSKVKDYTRVE